MMPDLFTRSCVEELREAWQEITQHEGGHCPVCDRWGKIYARAVNETMARSLIWLAARDGWVDVPRDGPRWVVRSNQLPTLRWWGLVERQENHDPKNKHSGMWRATEKGRGFASNTVSVPYKVFTYNAEPVAWSDAVIHIAECFGTRFDYEAVMSEHELDDETEILKRCGT